MTRLLALVFALALEAPAWAQPAQPIPSTTTSIALPTTTQSRTTLVAGVAGMSIYITASLHLVGGASSVVTWSDGTTVISLGPGLDAVMVVPTGLDPCLTVGTAAASGWLAYSVQ
jgi:hypothetical protein